MPHPFSQMGGAMRSKRRFLGVSQSTFTSPVTWSDDSFPKVEPHFHGVDITLGERRRFARSFHLMNQQSVFNVTPAVPARERFCPDDWTNASAADSTTWTDEESC